MQVGLMTKRYKWIITNLDAHTIDLDPFQYSGTHIMTLRILNPNHSVFSAPLIDDDIDPFGNEPDPNDDFYSKNCAVPTDQLVSMVPEYPERFNGNSPSFFCICPTFRGEISTFMPVQLI